MLPNGGGDGGLFVGEDCCGFATDVVREDGVGEADLLGCAVDKTGVDKFAECGVERRGDRETMALPNIRLIRWVFEPRKTYRTFLWA